jgi:putative glutamine amidotransferase
MLRIGLSQRVEVVERYGERRDCLDQEWTRLIAALGYLPVPLPNCLDDVDGLLSTLQLSGVILTGGNDLSHLQGARHTAPERDRFEHRLLGLCTQAKIPVLGVCRGMQMLVCESGGRLSASQGHVGVRHPVRVDPTAGLPLTDRQAVNSFHNFGVQAPDVGANLRAAATADDGSVEAVAHEHLPWWGIMWHPERSPSNPEDAAFIRWVFERTAK